MYKAYECANRLTKYINYIKNGTRYVKKIKIIKIKKMTTKL